MLVFSIPLATAQKPIDYFKKGITPPYPLKGVIRVKMSHDDYHFSSTVDGTTYSFHCSTSEHDVTCSDGSEISTYIYLPDGTSMYIGQKDNGNDPWLLADIKGTFKDPLHNNPGDATFNLRWREFDSNLKTGVLCVQAPGTESIPEGRERKEYAKHHHMEYCYFAILNNGPLEPASERLAKIKAAASRDIKH